MTIGSWTPDSEKPLSNPIDHAFLLRCVAHINQGNAENLQQSMSQDDQARQSVMHCEQGSWDAALSGLQHDQLLALIKFFTLAEMQLPNWQAGQNSPVIAINRYLKKQGDKLDKSTLLWIRENSTNRFIPNGPLAL